MQTSCSRRFRRRSFVTLTFYDFFALRTIGRDAVPYRVAAIASFTSYTIGHNLGATVFTAGAIRFRIYSAWGLRSGRRCQDCIHHRADILAGQCVRARAAACLRRRQAASAINAAAAMDQPRPSACRASR